MGGDFNCFLQIYREFCIVFLKIRKKFRFVLTRRRKYGILLTRYNVISFKFFGGEIPVYL